MSPTSRSDRLLCALWFAAMGAIPITATLFALNPARAPENYVLFFVFPVLCAAVCGAVYGVAILNGERVPTLRRAVVRGVLTAVAAYFLLALLAGVGMMAIVLIAAPTSIGIGALFVFAATVIGVLAIGPVALPWLAPLMVLGGALAGGLLWLNRSRLAIFSIAGSAAIIVLAAVVVLGLPDWTNPPFYPNATNIETTEWQTVDSGTAQQRTIAFETSDSTDTARTTYSAILARDQWQPDGCCALDSSHSFRAGSKTFLSAGYTLSVAVEPTAAGRTRIHLTLKKTMGL